MKCVDFYSKVTVSRQVQSRKQWPKEDGYRHQLIECRQESAGTKHRNGKRRKKKKKKIKICIYTHDLIRIYTNVVVSNKQ